MSEANRSRSPIANPLYSSLRSLQISASFKVPGLKIPKPVWGGEEKNAQN